MSAPKASEKTWASNVDYRTATPGVYRRGSYYRVLTRPDGERKVMRRFETYEEAVAFKATTPNREFRRERRSKPYSAEIHLRRDPCSYCGKSSDTIDHIVPRACGGVDDWTNWTGACLRCNVLKGTTPLLVFLARLNGCWEWRRIATEATN